MAKLRFVFTRDDGIVSRIVRWLDGGNWSHVAVGLDVSPIYWQAQAPNGVECLSLDSLLAGTSANLQLTLEVPDAIAAMEYANAHAGAPYDYLAILELAWRDLFGVAPHIDRPGAFYCDELCTYAVRAAGGVLRDDKGADLVQASYRVGVEGFRQALLRAGAGVA